MSMHIIILRTNAASDAYIIKQIFIIQKVLIYNLQNSKIVALNNNSFSIGHHMNKLYTEH